MHISKLSPQSMRLHLLTLLLCVLFACPYAKAQRLQLKTNSLEYLALTPNLALETRLSRKLSLQVGFSANPFTKAISDVKLQNMRFEPELRYWFNRPMARHFLALSLTAGNYSLRFDDRFIQGDVFAAGISYGYALVLSKHWNMEAEIGIGVGNLRGYDYRGEDNRPTERNYNKTMPVPIRFGLTFGYVFK